MRLLLIIMLTAFVSATTPKILNRCDVPAYGEQANTNWYYRVRASNLDLTFEEYLLVTDDVLLLEAPGISKSEVRKYVALHTKVGKDKVLTFDALLDKYTNKAIGSVFKNEGYNVHWNKGEKGFTTPGGIYSYYHKNNKAVLYVKRLFREHHISETRANVKKLNKVLSKKVKNKILDMVIEYHKTQLKKDKIFINLIKRKRYKSSVAYYNHKVLAFNNGIKRMRVVLKKHKNSSDVKIVKVFTIKMSKYYKYLATIKVKNKKGRFVYKYKRFLNGWLNRCVKSSGGVVKRYEVERA